MNPKETRFVKALVASTLTCLQETAQQPSAVWAAMAYDVARNAVAVFNRNAETWTLRIARKRAINIK